jgi:hypothetical protein
MFGNRANDVALGEHAGRGITFGSDDVLDHERTDIAGAHQLRGNGDSFVHANRHDARSFLAQDVSDLHRNLLWSTAERFAGANIGIQYANCQYGL